MPIITLTTDFGLRDHYVACMKGVIMQIAPKATLVDVSHDIPSHRIMQGAFVLAEVLNWFPPGSVHLAVVDPGVGTPRRILIGKYAGRLVVAPDNGLITFVHQRYPIEELRVVENSRFALPNVSATFHGRDIMAPAAAHLAMGRRPQEFGPQTDRVEVLQVAHPTLDAQHCLTGRIIYVDKFGNLTTNIGPNDLSVVLRHRPAAQVYLGETCIGGVQSTYGNVAAGSPIALIGSSQDHLGPAPDTVVQVK
jgi:S-adenosylmethionine hydrolase